MPPMGKRLGRGGRFEYPAPPMGQPRTHIGPDGHNYIGQNYIGHNYMGHNYMGGSPVPTSAPTAITI